MPLFSISTANQQQGSQAGAYSYPQLGQVKKDTKIFDEFDRESLNPTNAYVFYTVAVTGTGTGAIAAGGLLSLQSSAVIGDDVSVRTSGLQFSRISTDPSNFEARSRCKFDFYFNNVVATDTEGFIGIIRSTSALTALPTTVRHLGVYWDTSAGANYMLTSANGTTQVTTDTGIAVGTTPTNPNRLEIVWNGLDSATINFYTGTSGSSYSTLVKTQTVTAFGAGVAATFENTIHFFVQSEAIATTRLDIQNWKCEVL